MTKVVIWKTAGGQTSAMDEATAKTYLGNLIGAGTRLTNLGQALTQACNGQGKSNGNLLFNGQKTHHASAGKAGVSSVTLFYFSQAGNVNIFAMGQHKDGSSYELCDFQPTTGTFSSKTVAL